MNKRDDNTEQVDNKGVAASESLLEPPLKVDNTRKVPNSGRKTKLKVLGGRVSSTNKDDKKEKAEKDANSKVQAIHFNQKSNSFDPFNNNSTNKNSSRLVRKVRRLD